MFKRITFLMILVIIPLHAHMPTQLTALDEDLNIIGTQTTKSLFTNILANATLEQIENANDPFQQFIEWGNTIASRRDSEKLMQEWDTKFKELIAISPVFEFFNALWRDYIPAARFLKTKVFGSQKITGKDIFTIFKQYKIADNKSDNPTTIEQFLHDLTEDIERAMQRFGIKDPKIAYAIWNRNYEFIKIFVYTILQGPSIHNKQFPPEIEKYLKDTLDQIGKNIIEFGKRHNLETE